MATVDLIDDSYLLSRPTAPCVAPGVGNKASYFDRSDDSEGWQRISSQFDEWLKSPGHEDEDGYVYPSLIAIGTASKILHEMRKENFPLPNWVVMNGDGGIVLKFEEGDTRKTVFEIEENGEIEMRRYVNSRVVGQIEITL